MRIALWHNLPSGGGLRVLDDQVRGLTRRGHEIHVWSPPTAAAFSSSDLVTASHVVPLARPRRRGSRAELVAGWFGSRPDIDAFSGHSARCAAEIATLAPDVVLAHPCQFFRVPAIGAHLELPSACYLQEPNRRLQEATFRRRTAQRPESVHARVGASTRQWLGDIARLQRQRVQLEAEMQWVDGFDDVLVNSLFSRETVLRAYGRDTVVCRLGIDTERFAFQSRPPHSRGTALFVGAMVIEKNPEFIVRAVGEAGAAVQRFTWVANYVDPACRELVTRTAAEVGVSIEIREAISDAALLDTFAESDVFVYAPRLEPFGLAPLEANATGLPVVAVAEGGVRETVVDGVNGIVVDPDVCAFGTAVKELLGDVARARSLGTSAREHVVAHWSLDASIDRLERALVAVAEGRSVDR